MGPKDSLTRELWGQESRHWLSDWQITALLSNSVCKGHCCKPLLDVCDLCAQGGTAQGTVMPLLSIWPHGLRSSLDNLCHSTVCCYIQKCNLNHHLGHHLSILCRCASEREAVDTCSVVRWVHISTTFYHTFHPRCDLMAVVNNMESCCCRGCKTVCRVARLLIWS